MNAFDIVLAIIVLLGLARGFQKGLIKSFIGVIGWLVALVVASKFSSSAGNLFVNWIDSPQLQIASGFLLIVLIAITLIHIVGMIAEKILAELNLSILNRFAGGIFGAAKGLLFVLIMLSLTAPMFKKMSFWQSSIFVPELLPLAPIAMALSKEVVHNSLPNLIPKSLDKQSQKNNDTKSNKNTKIDSDASENNIDDISIDDISVVNDEAFSKND